MCGFESHSLRQIKNRELASSILEFRFDPDADQDVGSGQSLLSHRSLTVTSGLLPAQKLRPVLNYNCPAAIAGFATEPPEHQEPLVRSNVKPPNS